MQETFSQLAAWWPEILFIAIWIIIWLFAVNWAKLGPVLRQGGWAPALLLLLTVALVWSRLAPAASSTLGFVVIPNFWWQFGDMCFLACLALFCGWLQSFFGLSVPEISTEPPAHSPSGHEHH